MSVGCQNLIPRYPVHHQSSGPLDCADVTLVYHISVSLLYMFFSRSLLKCYLLQNILHSSQVKDKNELTLCQNKPSCVPGRYHGLYRYCHRRHKARVAWPHYAGHLWHYRQGRKLEYMYEHMASDGSLDVVNLLTISADTKVSLYGQLPCAPILQHLCWAFVTL